VKDAGRMPGFMIDIGFWWLWQRETDVDHEGVAVMTRFHRSRVTARSYELDVTARPEPTVLIMTKLSDGSACRWRVAPFSS
jgi:hypothetical protein